MSENNENESLDEERPDGVDLCIHCLEPVGYHAHFCIHCRAPQGFLAATVPYISVFAEGFIWRTAVCSPRHWLSVVGIWFVFGCYMLTGIGGLSWVYYEGFSSFSSWGEYCFAAINVGLVVLGGGGIIRSTVNYFRYKRGMGEV